MFTEIGPDKLLLLLAIIVLLVAARRVVHTIAIRRGGAQGHRRRQAQHTSRSAHADGARGGGALPRRGILHHRLLTCIEVLAAAVFLMVGGAKLLGVPDMVALFQAIGVGQWLRYVTGGIEVCCAVLLLVPVLSGASALVLSAVMAAATLIELLVLRRPPVAAMVCLAAHGYIAWGRREWARWFDPTKHRVPGRRETLARLTKN